jgi:hypothetical protein
MPAAMTTNTGLFIFLSSCVSALFFESIILQNFPGNKGQLFLEFLHGFSPAAVIE